MKNSILKLTSMFIILFILSTIMPIFSYGAEIAKEGIVLKKENGERLIYLEGMKDVEFKYAFSNDKNDENLSYLTALKDSNAENVALLESDQTYKYMFVQNGEEVSTIDLENAKNISENEIKDVEKLTKIIGVKTTESSSNVSKAEDGTTITTTIGKINITDEGNYQYQMLEVLDKNKSTATLDETAVELYNQLSKIASAQNMYDKLLAEITIRDDYEKLIKNAKWKDATNKEIMQPENSQDGEKFVVLIQEVKEEKTIRTDVQFMTCAREDDADVEVTNTLVTKTVEKKVTLPITGENLALYIIFAVVIIAIIILAIRMKQKGKQDEE